MNKEYFAYNKSIEYATEHFTRVLKEVLRKIYKKNNIDISHEEFLILDTIYNNPGCTQSDMIRVLFIQRSYLCKILVAMEEKSLIERENSIRGKRQVVMKTYLSDEGKNKYMQVRDYLMREYFIDNTIDFNELDKITQDLLSLSEKMKEVYNLKL